MIYAGSLVFTVPAHPVDLRNWGEWWTLLKGANWRHPYGPKSNIHGLDNHPVVHVTFADALAYARGPARTCRPKRSGSSPRAAGSTAPSMPGATSSRPAASTWPIPGRASFRTRTTTTDGFERTSPVTAFPPNGYGVHDMIGNVWEWTTDWYSPKHEADAPKACCIPENPRGGREEDSYDPLPAGHQDSAQGDQGRLAPLRAELLPPLSPGRASCRADRHVDQPSRISLHRHSEQVVSGSASTAATGGVHHERADLGQARTARSADDTANDAGGFDRRNMLPPERRCRRVSSGGAAADPDGAGGAEAAATRSAGRASPTSS